MTIQFTHVTSGGVEHVHELPAAFEVCPGCDGHGAHLHPAIREHAYTQDEFNEAFSDEDERAAYFTPGGRYDIECETCHGRRVVRVIDHDAAAQTLRGRRLLALHAALMDADLAYAAERDAERRMGA